MSKRNVNPWIDHAGGPCPVPEDTMVDVRFRDRDIESDIHAGFWSDWWLHDGSATDIVAYRLSKVLS